MQRMTDEKMLAQREQVARGWPSSGRGRMVLLHGTELNIAPDGSVDWDEDFLAGFDVCVASVHSHFDLPGPQMTRRFITACENPQVNVIGHPLTRKIGTPAAGRRGPARAVPRPAPGPARRWRSTPTRPAWTCPPRTSAPPATPG